jgi:transposase
MAKRLVPDELWAIVKPLLPPHASRERGGRPPVDDRACFAGILFVLKTGIGWEDLPREMGCGSGMTCWRRLRDWHRAGVFQRLHECCWPSCARPVASTGKAWWSTARRCGPFLGGADRPESDGSGQERQQAPPGHRRRRRPLGGDGHRRQPPRPDATAAADRGDPAHQGTGRGAAEQTKRGHRRPRLRQQPASHASLGTRHPSDAGAKTHRARQRVGPVPLGG